MARRRTELVNPATGQRLVFLKTAAETGGELLEMESYYHPHGLPPGPHYHPVQRERFEVLAGTLRVSLDGAERRLEVGDVLFIEPGTVHEMWNADAEWTHVNWQVQPALKTEQFFETVYALARDGKVNAKGVPNLLQIAVLMQAYDRELRVSRPPRIIQKVLFLFLAPIARLLGYCSRYH